MMTYTITPLAFDDDGFAETPFGQIVLVAPDTDGNSAWEVRTDELDELLSYFDETGEVFCCGNTREEAVRAANVWNIRKMLTGLTPACDLAVPDRAEVEAGDDSSLQPDIHVMKDGDNVAELGVFVDSRGMFKDDVGSGSILMHKGRPTRAQFYELCDSLGIKVDNRLPRRQF